MLSSRARTPLPSPSTRGTEVTPSNTFRSRTPPWSSHPRKRTTICVQSRSRMSSSISSNRSKIVFRTTLKTSTTLVFPWDKMILSWTNSKNLSISRITWLTLNIQSLGETTSAWSQIKSLTPKMTRTWRVSPPRPFWCRLRSRSKCRASRRTPTPIGNHHLTKMIRTDIQY